MIDWYPAVMTTLVGPLSFSIWAWVSNVNKLIEPTIT